MPIPINPNARAAAKAALIEGLPVVRIKNGTFVDGFSAFVGAYKAGQALPQNGQIFDQMIEIVDESPLATFVGEVLRLRLRDERDYHSEPEYENLVEAGIFGGAEDLAEWLIQQFESLPWRYSIAIELPSGALATEVVDQSTRKVGDNCQVVNSDLFFEDKFPLTHPNERRNNSLKPDGLLGLLGPEPRWKEGSIFFVQEREGFIGNFGGGSTMDHCAFALESFIGLGLAMRLFNYRFRFDNEKIRSEWRVHHSVGEKWEYLTRFELDEESNEVLRHVRSFRFEDDYPEERRIPWLRSVVEKISNVFSAEDSETIQLAAKWFFDSYKGKDQALRYIRLMTTLEILLGEHADRSKASLGDILGNRLAYLIGKNHKERREVLQKFKKIYGVRSGILHHGKHKLKSSEFGLISELETYCRRAIEEEARLLIS